MQRLGVAIVQRADESPRAVRLVRANRIATRSRAALMAENLFRTKQLTMFQERSVNLAKTRGVWAF